MEFMWSVLKTGDLEVVTKSVKAFISAYAEFFADPKVDVFKLAEHLGFKVIEIDHDSLVEGKEVEGIMIIDKAEIGNTGSKKIICINSTLSSEEKRFAIAHEIGHYIYHHFNESTPTFEVRFKTNKKYNKNYRDNYTQDKPENEADFFAASILMPQNLVEREIDAYRIKNNDKVGKEIFGLITHLATTFSVDTMCAMRRYFEVNDLAL